MPEIIVGFVLKNGLGAPLSKWKFWSMQEEPGYKPYVHPTADIDEIRKTCHNWCTSPSTMIPATYSPQTGEVKYTGAPVPF